MQLLMFQLSDGEKSNGVKPISPEQEELIHRLVYFQNEYEHPSEEDVKRILVSSSFKNKQKHALGNGIYKCKN